MFGNILTSKGINGGKIVEQKDSNFAGSGALLLIMGTLLNITRDPFMWGTGIVTALFMILLFRIDPLSPNE